MNFSKFFKRLLLEGVNLDVEVLSKNILYFRLEKNGVLNKVYYSKFGLEHDDDEKILENLNQSLDRLESWVSLHE